MSEMESLLTTLSAIEKLSASVAGRVRTITPMLSDPSLRDVASLVEAYAALSLGLSRALRDYLYVRSWYREGMSTPKPGVEEVEAALRMVNEALDELARLEDEIGKLGSLCRDERVIGIVSSWAALAGELRRSLQELRRKLEEELTALQERPLPEAQ